MRDAQLRNRSPDKLTTGQFVGRILLAGLLAFAAPAVRADESPSATTELLTLMRIDDQLLAQLGGVLKLRCARYPGEQREQCTTVGAQLLRDIEGNQFARLMAPFFDHNFTTTEIEALTEFYASRDGKRLADLYVTGSYYRITGEISKDVQPLDQATQDRVEIFLQSAVGKKLMAFTPQFMQEKDRQVTWYVCTVLSEERHKNVRSILPDPCAI